MKVENKKGFWSKANSKNKTIITERKNINRNGFAFGVSGRGVAIHTTQKNENKNEGAING